MCEANAAALLDALDDTIAELVAARAELAEHGTVGRITEQGHAARTRYDNARRTPFIPVLDGAGWQRALREAGHAGGVVAALG